MTIAETYGLLTEALVEQALPAIEHMLQHTTLGFLPGQGIPDRNPQNLVLNVRLALSTSELASCVYKGKYTMDGGIWQ